MEEGVDVAEGETGRDGETREETCGVSARCLIDGRGEQEGETGRDGREEGGTRTIARCLGTVNGCVSAPSSVEKISRQSQRSSRGRLASPSGTVETPVVPLGARARASPGRVGSASRHGGGVSSLARTRARCFSRHLARGSRERADPRSGDVRGRHLPARLRVQPDGLRARVRRGGDGGAPERLHVLPAPPRGAAWRRPRRARREPVHALSFEELARFCGSDPRATALARVRASSYSSSAPAAAVSPSSARLVDARSAARDSSPAGQPGRRLRSRPRVDARARALVSASRRRRTPKAPASPSPSRSPPRPRPALRSPRHHQPRPRGRRRTRAPPRARRRRRLASGARGVPESRRPTPPVRVEGQGASAAARAFPILGYAFYVHPVLLPMLKEMTARERAEGRRRRRGRRRRARDESEDGARRRGAPPSRRDRNRDFRVGRRRSRVARVVGGVLGCFFRRRRLASFASARGTTRTSRAIRAAT